MTSYQIQQGDLDGEVDTIQADYFTVSEYGVSFFANIAGSLVKSEQVAFYSHPCSVVKTDNIVDEEGDDDD